MSLVQPNPLRPSLLALAIALALPLASTSALAAPVSVNQPAQALGDALNTLASQTGLRLLFASNLVAGKQAPALSGSYEPAQALQKLLAGSGLEALPGADGSFAIRAIPHGGNTQELGEVTVTASKEENPTGQVKGYVAQRTNAGKSKATVLESAQSISVVTRDAMDDRAVQSVNEAVRYSAGTLAAPYGEDTRYDWFFLRGFSGIYDTWRDGLRITGSNFAVPKINTYGLERVEVVRGPSSVLYGQGNPGGLVSMTTKRPTDTPYHEVGILGGSFNNKQIFTDLSDKLDEQGEWRYRLTAIARDAETVVDQSKDDGYYIAPSISWSPSADTTLTFLAQYQKDSVVGLYTGTPAPQLISAMAAAGITLGVIPQERNTGNPDFEKFDRDYTALGYALEHRFNDTWSLTQNLRYESTQVDYNRAQLVGLLPPGDPSNPFYPVNVVNPTSEVVLTQDAITDDEQVRSLLLDQNLTGNWKNSGLDYTLTGGLDLGWTEADQRELSGDLISDPTALAVIGALGTTPLYGYTLNGFNPNPSYPVIAAPDNLDRDVNIKSSKIGAYVQNRFRFQENWLINLAGRQDWVSSETENHLTSTTAKQHDNAFSGQASLMYVSTNGIAPYASYSTGFSPVLDVDAQGNPFEPSTAEQTELGVKWQPNSNVLLALAVYDLNKQNVVTANPDGSNKQQTGEVRSRGLETEGTLSLDNGLKLIASYTHNNAEITANKNRPNFVGSTPELVPENMATAWLDYTLQNGLFKGLGAGIGARYIGSMQYLTDDTVGQSASGTQVNLEGYTLLDAALRYQWQKWSVSVNGQNLAGKEYFAWCTAQICQYGQPRSFIATAKYRW